MTSIHRWVIAGLALTFARAAFAEPAVPAPQPLPKPILILGDAGDGQAAQQGQATQQGKAAQQSQAAADLDGARTQLRVADIAVAQAREMGAYLGVSTAHPPEVLRRQLGLSRGFGLVVQFVVPDGPAAKAGLKPFDVLQKLDDQWLINYQQLAALVRSHNPGDEVKLTVIHQGKALTYSAKLEEHELEPLNIGDDELHEYGQAGDDAREHPAVQVAPTVAANPAPAGQSVTATSVTWLDSDHSCTLTEHGGRRIFSVRDKEGKVLFEGPVDTPEQRNALPAELGEKLRYLQSRMAAPKPAVAGDAESAGPPGAEDKK